MKIALAQLNYTIGDFQHNKEKIVACIDAAKKQAVQLVVFSEQAISGAPAYDLLNKVSFLNLCEETLQEIATRCEGISVLIGLPVQGTNKTISVAALIENKRIKRYVGKQTIITRDEMPYISPSKGCEYIKIGDKKIAVVVGEDIRTEQQYGEYTDIIVNLSNSSYCRGKIEKRYDFYRQLAFMTGKPIIYVNSVGAQTDIIYDGSSAFINSRGEAVALLKSFEEDFQIVDCDEDTQTLEFSKQNKTVNVFNAIKLGLKDYFSKNGFKKACLGLSGGIDSAVVLSMAAEALGAENVRVLLMPSQFSSDHSVEDARKLAENLGVEYQIVPINETFAALTTTLGPVFGELPFDVTEENMQSRIRGMMMMAISNKFGNVLLSTANKSEIATGYGTLYGDMVGALSIIGDLYKSEVYDLARYINRDKEIIPINTIIKAPSAELRLEQKVSDSLPPYDILDAILYRMIEEGQSREEIINAGFDEEEVYRVYNMVLTSEFKRYQYCPTLRLSTCTLGINRHLPLTNKYGY